MSQQDQDGNVAGPIIGLILLAASPVAFMAFLVINAGWWTVVFPALALLTLVGYRMAFVRERGNAGARERETGTGYVIELDPDDPDAGLPRPSA